MRALAASFAIIASPVIASSNPPITPSEALHNVGACMTVEGHASMFQDSNRPGIDIYMDSYPSGDQVVKTFGREVSAFMVYVPDPDSFSRPVSYGQSVLQMLDGQDVAITGVVMLDRGAPTIQLNNPELIRRAGTDPGKLVTCDND